MPGAQGAQGAKNAKDAKDAKDAPGRARRTRGSSSEKRIEVMATYIVSQLGAKVLRFYCINATDTTGEPRRTSMPESPREERTTTASSGCRPRPTAPDPAMLHGNSQKQATAGLTDAGEATSTASDVHAIEPQRERCVQYCRA